MDRRNPRLFRVLYAVYQTFVRQCERAAHARGSDAEPETGISRRTGLDGREARRCANTSLARNDPP
ncbi:hypothetical protein D1F64_03990 [Breoghania sp. L-A4]|nr:hypothetical protein D1F64_03990 [Breoghania sp. L-A4]